MGKHNGKSRTAHGVKVGAALARRHRGGAGGGGAHAGRHTTDAGPGMSSVLERNDLDELMAMAELADRDFTAERYQPVVVGSSAHNALSEAESAAVRAQAEARAADKLSIPRRPDWDASTTPEQLDAQERASFLEWRRGLAALEEEEGLLLTPFERNLEVWRQLWRVLERSDIVVQVVDGRDPLTYWSADLAAYAAELHPTKSSMVLLNKADLLPAAVRNAWADYFAARGVRYAFWSAYAATEAQARARHDAVSMGLAAASAEDTQRHFCQLLGSAAASSGSERTRVLPVDELLELLEKTARDAVDAADEHDPRRSEPGRRAVVGLVGYPNVGKSSTINALFGAKKTAVAPTPGKTKHFQTLNAAPGLCLCDCPGLVFPRFAASKADMVAAGVIPIDRLTDVRAPIDVVASRCGAAQLAAVYGLQLGPRGRAAAGGGSGGGSSGAAGAVRGDADGAEAPLPPLGTRLLVALARARGWTASGGLPDEARAGRQVLRDYTSGRLLHCRLPPGHQQASFAPDCAPLPGQVDQLLLLGQQHAGGTAVGMQAPRQQRRQQDKEEAAAAAAAADDDDYDVDDDEDEEVEDEETTSSGSAADGALASSSTITSSAAAASAAEGGQAAAAATAGGQGSAPSSSQPGAELLLSEADLELMEGLGMGSRLRPRRAEHKFQRKAPRTKGSRGAAVDAGGYDGAAIATGKKGGLVRVGGYV